MRKGFSLLAIAAVLAQGPAVADMPVQHRYSSDRGFCRTPDALPSLGREEVNDQVRPGPVPRPRAAIGGRASPEGVMAPPPPAPPPPPAMADSGGDDVVVTSRRSDEPRSATSRDKRVAESEEAPAGSTSSRRPGPYPRPGPRPQAGLLTAGEHDDLLNPELYADYVRRSDLGQSIRGLPRVDTGRVLTVVVHDRAGRPVPFVPVEIACSDGNRLQLSTMADGSVAFFPGIDRLSPQIRVRAGASDWRAVSVSGGGGGQQVDFTLGAEARAAQKLDLMLVIDTTGSMGDEIRYLQAELGSIVDALRARHRNVDIRVGFVFYRDIGDDYVTATVPLSGDINAAQRQLQQRYAGGGGDYPEAMDQALIRAAGQGWRPDAVKSLLLVADAPPHDEQVGRSWLAAEHLRANRVHIVPVAASGVADTAEYVMRAMAAATQSRYTFLTDDSGIGNSHAPPAIDCYLVTRLDALLRRVIDSQLSGRRVEPDRAEVIRTVGQYDSGRCVIPERFGQG